MPSSSLHRNRNCGRHLSARDLLAVAAFGLIGNYAASLLDFAALVLISLDLERLVLYTYPLIVVLLSALAFGRRITRSDVLAFGIAYLGLTLMLFDDRARAGATPAWVDGVLLVLLSATAYAVYLTGSQKVILRLGAKRYTALAMLAVTGGTLLHFSLSGPTSQLFRQPAAVYGYGFALAIWPSFLTSERNRADRRRQHSDCRRAGTGRYHAHVLAAARRGDYRHSAQRHGPRAARRA